MGEENPEEAIKGGYEVLPDIPLHGLRHPYVKATTKNYSISKTPHSTMKSVMGSSVHS